MKKKIKIAAGFLTVIFCILLGCERREREGETLFLEEDGPGSVLQEEGGAEIISPKSPEPAEAGEGRGTDISARPGLDNGGREMESRVMEAQDEKPDKGPQSPGERETCVVHICGAVNAPGVYTLEGGCRIYQAIEKAGGFREDAQQDYLNQADLLSDGMKVYVPTQEEARESGGDAGWVISGREPDGSREREENKEDTGGNSFPVNINTAGEEQLCTLPGVGSSKARSIIAYREQNGPYKTIEDIMNVEGIKDGVFRKIRDSITV